MTVIETTDRLASAIARADALLLAIESADLPEHQANALTFLAGEVRDYIASLSVEIRGA